MKTGKKKARPQEYVNDDSLHKPGKKAVLKKDRKISIYNPIDEEDDESEIDDLFDYDPDNFDEDEDESD
jgi:hypothetical protein